MMTKEKCTTRGRVDEPACNTVGCPPFTNDKEHLVDVAFNIVKLISENGNGYAVVTAVANLIQEFANQSNSTPLKLQPIETAPRDGTEIIVYAKWDWEHLNTKAKYAWRVAIWADFAGGFDEETYECLFGWETTSSNPYADYGADALYWIPLPTPTKEDK